MRLKGVVIDEAHCVSQWGHDFRPWYRRLVQTVMGLARGTPVLATTATAPAKVVEDVQEQIAPDGQAAVVIRLASSRANLALGVYVASGLAGRLVALVEFARSHPGKPGLAYALTRSDAETAAGFLAESGLRADFYHAGMNTELRGDCLDRWKRGASQVICATSALGMGLDRSDLRWVVHLGMPDSLIRYVQEIGRAGRDGGAAHALAIHDDDKELERVYKWLISATFPAAEDYRAVADAMRAGCRTRTQIIERRDIPDEQAQRILDDLVDRALCARSRAARNSYEYEWRGGDRDAAPEGADNAAAVRGTFLAEALAYPGAGGCRAVTLARAMGDDPLPGRCGICDNCATWPARDLARLRDEASRHLALHTPRIGGKRVGKAKLEEGVALSFYGLGTIGEAVKSAKYNGQPAPPEVAARAKGVLADPKGPYAGVEFSAVVMIPSTKTVGFVDGFAEELARHLGIPCVKLTKTRATRQQKEFRSRLLKERNVRGAFRAPGDIGEAVLLVDDMWDSGCSMKEAASVLAPARVYPLVMARTRHGDG